jgi:hypothetical protein
MVKVEAIEVRSKVETVAMRMENELGGLGGNSNVETFFKLLVVSDAKNIPILVFPRECDVFDEDPDASRVGGANAGIKEHVDDGKA